MPTTPDLPPCEEMEDWLSEHTDAVLDPTFTERPIVTMVAAIQQLVNQYRTDKFLRVGIVNLIEGVLVLLNGPVGRLDKGTVDAFLRKQAEVCHYDLALAEFTD